MSVVWGLGAMLYSDQRVAKERTETSNRREKRVYWEG